ncbi:MAG TPA: enoyl-CoA hydratase-related protein [Acidimicrobiales bacterium]|nr:enoyl-CoA hydratase-related protein [Acidimicrobiales bacterium]
MADWEVRVLVLTRAGERSFCLGSNIVGLDAYPDPWAFCVRPDHGDSVRSIRTPVMAAINGYAYGGGLELAMSCDVRIASRNATFAAPEIKLGWVGGGGQAAFLAHSAGPSNASLMLLTGDPIDAQRALAWGIVSEVVDLEALRARARELATTIAARPPIAAETAKLNVRNAYSLPLEHCILYERDLQTICFTSEDAAEGRAAFKEKRVPKFRGR